MSEVAVSPVEVTPGDGPVVIGLPHAGTAVPPGVLARLNPRGRARADTDWHVDRLHEGLLPDATAVRATFHRYVIDANRPPDGASLYPRRNTTGLVPLTDFDGAPIWDEPPDAAEIEARRAAFHAPYHAALAAALERARAAHGVAILYDAHSIRSRVPFLFEGVLPDLNIGTADGAACAPALEAEVARLCAEAEGFTSVLNGRFKGGWTTRAYGRPAEGLHAIQMEIAQSAYLESEEPPFAFDPAKAARLRPVLGRVLGRLARAASEVRA